MFVSFKSYPALSNGIDVPELCPRCFARHYFAPKARAICCAIAMT